MTALIWPTDLPRPERQTWQAQRQDARRARQNEGGPPAWRRRFSNAATLITASILVSRSQKAVFDRFYDFDTQGGTLDFRMPDPTTHGWKLLTSSGRPMLTGGGRPLLMSRMWLCSFGQSVPSEAVVGIEFRISFSLVVYP